MREIKFRGWDSANREMFEVRSLVWDRWMNVVEGQDPIMQYTGLKDSKGKEIYEGDVVNMRHPDHIEVFTGKVVYDVEVLAYYLDGPRFYLMVNEFDEIEIIGNIYENPELLEGGI